MRRKGYEGESGPATLGSTAKAYLVLRMWCTACRHQVDLDPADLAERYGADLPVPEWAARLRCSKCGGDQVDFVVAPRSHGGVRYSGPDGTKRQSMKTYLDAYQALLSQDAVPIDPRPRETGVRDGAQGTVSRLSDHCPCTGRRLAS